jgi:hypothetical protein
MTEEELKEEGDTSVKLSDLYWGTETPKKDKYHSVTFETKVQPIQTIMYAFIDFGDPDDFKEE